MAPEQSLLVLPAEIPRQQGYPCQCDRQRQQAEARCLAVEFEQVDVRLGVREAVSHLCVCVKYHVVVVAVAAAVVLERVCGAGRAVW